MFSVSYFSFYLHKSSNHTFSNSQRLKSDHRVVRRSPYSHLSTGIRYQQCLCIFTDAPVASPTYLNQLRPTRRPTSLRLPSLIDSTTSGPGVGNAQATTRRCHLFNPLPQQLRKGQFPHPRSSSPLPYLTFPISGFSQTKEKSPRPAYS